MVHPDELSGYHKTIVLTTISVPWFFLPSNSIFEFHRFGTCRHVFFVLIMMDSGPLSQTKKLCVLIRKGLLKIYALPNDDHEGSIIRK